MRLARRFTLPTAACLTVIASCAFTTTAQAATTPDATTTDATTPDATTTEADATVTPKVGTPFPYIGIVQAAGEDRYGTAAIISQGSFAPSPDSAVFTTSGEAPADALTAGPAAASLDAPLLLTRADELPEATAAELERLAPSTVYVAGGTDRISGTTLEAITTAATAADPNATVGRIAGDDRYVTAVQVAEQFFPDALSGGAAAAAAGVPLMITEPGQVPEAVNDWLQDNTFETALSVGGPTSVSEPVAATVAARTNDPPPSSGSPESTGTSPAPRSHRLSSPRRPRR